MKKKLPPPTPVEKLYNTQRALRYRREQLARMFVDLARLKALEADARSVLWCNVCSTDADVTLTEPNAYYRPQVCCPRCSSTCGDDLDSGNGGSTTSQTLQTWIGSKGRALRVLWLYRQGLSMSQIGNIISRSTTVVRSLLHRGYMEWRTDTDPQRFRRYYRRGVSTEECRS